MICRHPKNEFQKEIHAINSKAEEAIE
jgi:hypothetical protein